MEIIRSNKEADIFTEGDFEGAGQYIVRCSKNLDFEVFQEGGRASTFIYKVGYENTSKGSLFCLSAISDGWVYEVGDIKKLLKHLNNNPHNDKYRWANEEELILVIKAQNKYRVKG